MSAEHQAVRQTESSHGKSSDNLAAACADSQVRFDRSAMAPSRFDQLDRNGKETTNLLVDTYGGNLNKGQKDLFKNSIMDSLQEKVGSLSKLAKPENAAAAHSFMDMMNNAGFEVSLTKSTEGNVSSTSLNIFQSGSTEGVRFTATSADGKGSLVCPGVDPIERNEDGSGVRSSHDLGAVVRTQQALSDHVKNYLDRE